MKLLFQMRINNVFNLKTKKNLLLFCLLFSGICNSLLADGNNSVSTGELIFYPGLKAKEKKEFYIYISSQNAVPDSNKTGSIQLKEQDGIVSVTNPFLQININKKTGRLVSLSGKTDAGAAFYSLGNFEICDPNISYKSKDGKVLKNPLPRNVTACAVSQNDVAAVLSYQGIYPETGLAWYRAYYVFSQTNYFLVSDVFKASGNAPEPYSYNIVYFKSRFKFAENYNDECFAHNKGDKQVVIDLELPRFDKETNWLVKQKYANLGSWLCQYNKQKNIFAGIVCKYHLTDRSVQVLRALNKNVESYFISVMRDIPLKPEAVTRDDKWIITGAGGVKEVSDFSYRINECLPFLVGKLELKTEQSQDWHSIGNNSQYRVKLTMNNYTNIDRSKDPFILPLEKLAGQIDADSVKSLHVIQVNEKGDGAQNLKNIEYPYQITTHGF